MIRDEEIKRLISYAEGLGTKVSFRQYKSSANAAAEWYVDGSQIIVYTWLNQSKTQLVLSLIHELGHHLHWIKANRKPDKELIEALQLEESSDEVIDKKYRKLIYQDEVEGTQYWSEIVKLVDIKINPVIIEAHKKLDVFLYYHYYIEGSFPTQRVKQQKLKEFKNNERK